VLGDICRTEPPPWQVDDEGLEIYCHIPLGELAAQQRPAFRFAAAGRREALPGGTAADGDGADGGTRG
jgi:hypothetical protein